MADDKATFAVELEDKTSAAAASAADALGKLQSQIKRDTKALGEMQAAMRRMQQGSSVNVAAFRELQGRIEKQKQAISDAQSKFVELGGSFSKNYSGAKRTGAGFDDVAKAAQKMGGPLGQAAGRFEALKAMVAGNALALGVAAVAAAILAVAAAAGVAAVALARYGLAQADARRNELLRLEALTRLRNRYGQVAGSATEMQSAIDRVSGSTALGRGKVEEYASQLYRMGLRGHTLSTALEGMTMQGSVLGDRYAQTFAGMAAGMARTGGSVDALTERVRTRVGGVASRQLLSFDTQVEKMREDISMLFSGLKIDGFLRALRSVTGLFSQNEAIGRALKGLLERMFQPLLDGAEESAPLMKRFFQGIVIAALRTENGILRLRIWFKRTFGDRSLFEGIDWMNVALSVGVGLFAGIAAAVGTVGLALFAIVGPILMIGRAVGVLMNLFDQAYGFISDLDWGGLGRQIVDGIVNGLRRAKNGALNAIRGLGGDLLRAFRSALDIHSPSKAFASLGVQIPRGVAVGVDTGTPAVERSVARMVDVPAQIIQPEAGSSSPSARSSSSVSVSIGDVHVHTQGGDARSIAADLRAELARVLEGVALEMGGSPA